MQSSKFKQHISLRRNNFIINNTAIIVYIPHEFYTFAKKNSLRHRLQFMRAVIHRLISKSHSIETIAHLNATQGFSFGTRNLLLL